MKRIAGLLFLVIAMAAALAQTPSSTAGQKLSPAERSMAQARKLIEKNPNDFEAYNSLALALSRRARETSNVAFYKEGEEALEKSLSSPLQFRWSKDSSLAATGKTRVRSRIGGRQGTQPETAR